MVSVSLQYDASLIKSSSYFCFFQEEKTGLLKRAQEERKKREVFSIRLKLE